MKWCFIILFFCTGFFNSALASGGGASTVGDGGFVVKCDRGLFKYPKIYFFDLFEFQVVHGQSNITFGDGANVKEKVQIGLARIAERFGLDMAEASVVGRAARAITGLSYDPWVTGDVHSLDQLEIRPVVTFKAVGQRLASEKCLLLAAAVKLNRQDSGHVFGDVCTKGRVSETFCLIKNYQIYNLLSDDEKACLVIHESLRYLPAAKALVDERSLRQVTAEICTQQ